MNSFLPLLLAASLACVYGGSLDRVFCGPVCLMYCPYGNVMDDQGCPLCKCMPKPILKHACPPVLCMVFCPNGYLTGDDGCPSCGCDTGPIS